MDLFTKFFRIAPLPDTDSEAFETFIVEQVLPAVDKGPTRGGHISRTIFYKETDAEREDRYVWIVDYDGFNAGWVDSNLEEAVEKLKTVGIPISSSVLLRLGKA